MVKTKAEVLICIEQLVVGGQAFFNQQLENFYDSFSMSFGAWEFLEETLNPKNVS